MNIKDFIIGTIIFLIILSVSSLFAHFNPQQSICEGLNGSEIDICFLKLAKQEKNQEYCKNITDFILSHACTGRYWERQDCKYEELIGLKDTCIMEKLNSYKINVCNELRSYESKKECKTFFMEKAIITKDISFCENNDFCIFYYAIENKDPEKCETLKELSSKFTNICITYLSMFLNLPEICTEGYCFIFDYIESKKEICLENNLNTSELAFCKTIDAIESKDPTMCSELILTNMEGGVETSIDAKPICLTALALRYKDTSFCEPLLGHQLLGSNLCKFYVTKDTSFCQNPAGEEKNCFTICDTYKDEYSLGICNEILENEQFESKKHYHLLGLFFD